MSQSERAHGIVALISACLIIVPSTALAIGDSGGCSSPSVASNPILRAAIEGTPDDIRKELEASVIKSEQFVDKQTKAKILADPNLQATWRAGKLIGLINSPLYCSTGEWILDYAVAAGNIPVVRWLLDSGTNPNAPSPSGGNDFTNIFSRCVPNPLDAYSKAFNSKAEPARRFEALDTVISRGGNIEMAGYNGENALHRCNNPDVLRYYLSKKVNLSPLVQPRRKYSPLQLAIADALSGHPWDKGIERVKAFTDTGANDIRGLEIERTLRSRCAGPNSDEICRMIGSLVRSTPGTFSSVAYKSKLGKIDKSEFGLYREACNFPEVDYLANYSAVAVVVEKAWTLPRTDIKFNSKFGEAQQIDVVINLPEKPIFILFNYESGPLIWNVFITEKTEVLGIAVAGNSDSPQVVSGLERPIPVTGDYFSGGRAICGRIIHPPNSRPKTFDVSGEPKLNPFVQRLDNVYPVIGPKILVGDPLRPDELLLHSFTSTPESFKNSGEPWSGRAGLENFAKAGVLRSASPEDIAAWEKQTKKRLPLVGTYVVLKGFKFPSGLYGINAANFIVPKGVPNPIGDPGQSAIYYSDNFKCLGASCYR